MNDDKLHSDITRGARARELLQDELLSEAFKTLEDSYIGLWRQTKPDQTADREKLFIAVNQIGKLRDHLHAVVSNGAIAQAELNKLINDAERKKRFGII